MSQNEQRRGTVTEENIEEAARLKAIYERRKSEGALKAKNANSQGAFGLMFEIGNQGAVWQFLNGHTALSLKAAAGFSKGLDCDIADFSPRLAKERDALAGAPVASPLTFADLNGYEGQLVTFFRDLRAHPALQQAVLVAMNNLSNRVKVAAAPSSANPFPHVQTPNKSEQALVHALEHLFEGSEFGELGK